VCTFDERFAGKANFLYYPYGTTWIHDGERAVYTKTKNLSIIASDKRFTHGQCIRHEVVARFRTKIDGVFGRGYQPIEHKVEGLAPYRYSITVENCNINSYFSEKLIDCFMTGTIPIYWGFGKVTDFFDTRGVLTFSSPEELAFILDRISPEDYESRIDAVRDNFQRALEYLSFEKHLWKDCLSKLVGC